ncbi:MAG TPA: FAD-binding oxidoreductase [Acidimicrobiales bacterium]
MSDRRRSWWGWGWEDQSPDADQTRAIAGVVAERFGLADLEIHPPVALEALALPTPRLQPPAALAGLCSSSAYDRAGHTHGKSYRDIVRNVRGELAHPPDVVARPTTEAEVVALLDWCDSIGAAAIPYGGGSSVVGGIEADVGDGYAGAVSIDLTALDQVVEIDRTSRAARIQGGALGPVLEDQLRPHGLTLRHFPQSFEFSTLGGWLATRSGGHYASVYTHIDDLVESMRVVTPTGISESRRLPGSGAGPSPDRWFLGSEGTLGIITEAWMRLQDRPVHRGSAAVHFTDLAAGAEAVRALSQAALFPTNCRLLDPAEAAGSAGTTDGSAVLVLGFESAHHPVEPWLEIALEECRDHGGVLPAPARYRSETDGADAPAAGSGAVEAWRNAFLRAPYGRDALVTMSVIAETFETACTWDRFGALHDGVTRAVTAALDEICGGGTITCRFTHLYPDGPAPYFTVMAPSRWGSELAQWAEIKAAASEALLAHGGTITHHHAVGRDHRPWYDRQRPDPFAAALRAAKAELDPGAILNPGVLVDPTRSP